MGDLAGRVGLALVVAVALGIALSRLPGRGIGSRDLALAVYAALVAILGVYAVLGVEAALIAGVVVLGALAVGLAIYVLLGLAGRWAQRD